MHQLRSQEGAGVGLQARGGEGPASPVVLRQAITKVFFR